MKFKSFLRFFTRRRSEPGTRGAKARRPRTTARFSVEALEDRTLLAVLPAVPFDVANGPVRLPDGLGGFGNPANTNSSTPSLSVDPNNAAKAVVVYSTLVPANQSIQGQDVFLGGQFTSNGGSTWQAFNLPLNDIDPASNVNNPLLYDQATDANVGFDRLGNFYVFFSQHAADNSSGSLTLLKYDFTGGTPRQIPNASGATTSISDGLHVYRWLADDQAVTPTMAVDTGIASFTDPTTGATNNNPWSNNIYVAWGTINTAPPAPNNTNFNPNIIQLASSSDGGFTFTSAATVNGPLPFESAGGFSGVDNGVFGLPFRYGSPKLAISQGTATLGTTTPTVAPGQVNILYEEFGAFTTQPVSQIMSDRVRDGAVSANFTDTLGGFIFDAFDPGNSAPHIPVNTDFSLPVNIIDPRFDKVSDVDVTVNIVHPNVQSLAIFLVPPQSSGLPRIQLFASRENSTGNAGNPPIGLTGANLGIRDMNAPFLTNVGLTFDDEATRAVNEGAAPYIGRYRPDNRVQFGVIPNYPQPFPNFQFATLNDLNGLTAGQLQGDWTLELWDTRSAGNTPPTQFLVDWSLKFTSGLTTGTDTFVSLTNQLKGAVTSPFPLAPTISPDLGIGPGAVIASDNTLGSFSPNQGRLYVAYADHFQNVIGGVDVNQPDNTDIFLAFSDDGGETWTQRTDVFGVPLPVNDDLSLRDGFSGSGGVVFQALGSTAAVGGRPQFQPQIAVDPATGTLVLSWLDGRNDAGRSRVATYVATSLDGGLTFGPQSFANQGQVAIDAITGADVVLQPIPENFSTNNGARETTLSVGNRQGLAVLEGQVYAAWAGNQNGQNLGPNFNPGFDVFAASASIASGPRIVRSTMGPITAETSDTIPFNDIFTSDGIQIPNAILVEFDRPIDPVSFTRDAVTVTFRPPTMASTQAGVNLDVLQIQALNPSTAGQPQVDQDTRFLIRFDARRAGLPVAQGGGGTFTGTYSYTISPVITDRIRSSRITVTPAGPPQTFPAVAPNIPLVIPPQGTGGSGIPADDNTLSRLIIGNIPAGQVIADVNVNLTLTHTFDDDLTITLIAPDNTRIVLSDQNGGPADNYTNTTFDDQATTSIVQGIAPFTGTFAPQGSLSRLIGKSPNGTWVLEIQDNFFADVGVLESWSLQITTGIISQSGAGGNLLDQNADGTPGQPAAPGTSLGDLYAIPRPVGTTVPTTGPLAVAPFDLTTLPIIVPGPHVVGTRMVGQPATSDNLVLNAVANAVDITFDRDMDATSITPSAILRMIGPNGLITGTFSITANPNGLDPDPNFPRTYRISFPEQAISGNYRVELASTVRARNGERLDTNLNAGLDVLRGAVGAGGTVANTRFTAPAATNTPLFASKANVSTITVTDDFVIQNVTLQLNILHPFAPDLVATLIHPDGTRVLLFDGVGNNGTRANFTNTIFDDNARDPQGNTVPIRTGVAPFNSPGTYNPQTPLNVLVGKRSAGVYQLEIVNRNAVIGGALTNWSLNFGKPVPASGLGEPVADRTAVDFRIFTLDPSNPTSRVGWTPVGPASISTGATTGNDLRHSGRIGGLAVDPSDPSGNTVFVAGASGGIWKTTNFLTNDPDGPSYVPLTDFGPGFSLNIGSIAVFARNNDPNQTIIFAATGEGDTSDFQTGRGVGFLRSLDGGATWALLDSTNNLDVRTGLPLPVTSNSRDRRFVGSTAFKVVVDPVRTVGGNVIVYAALQDVTSTNAAGIWRSMDSGNTWTLLRAGNATDVILSEFSASASTGNLQTVFGAFQGEGVFVSPNQGGNWNLLSGGVGLPLIRDFDVNPSAALTVTPAAGATTTPTGNKGRIVLAAPSLVPASDPNAAVKNLNYAGWLYAYVATVGGGLDGLYVTKDFGANWTRVRTPARGLNNPQTALPTNDESQADFSPFGTNGQANYDISVVVDPNNPNVVYVGGADGSPLPTRASVLRVDTTGIHDPYSFVPFDHNDPDGALQQASTGSLVLKNNFQAPLRFSFSGFQLVDFGSTPYINMTRDPLDPFLNNAAIFVSGVSGVRNEGTDIRWMPFGAPDAYDATLPNITGGSADQHEVVAIRDPLTGKTRLIFGDDQGVFSGIDLGDGTLLDEVGTVRLATGDRNGNLQITQLYQGAAQPSILAGEIAAALFYGQAQDDGAPSSLPNVLSTGNITWQPPAGGDGTGVDVDQTGVSGNAYRYNWPCCGGLDANFVALVPPGNPTDFGVGRTSGLLQAGDDPATGAGQWPFVGGFNIATNPIDGNQLLVSSASGQVFRTTNGGLQWFSITPTATGAPGTLDGSNAPALAFGAPEPNASSGEFDKFIYAGTLLGDIFVTLVGGGTVTGNARTGWRNVSGGLDGSSIQDIVPSPFRGSRQAYAATSRGVYVLNDAATGGWTNVTGNLFRLTHQVFGNQADLAGITNPASQLSEPLLKEITALAVDWRFADPGTNRPPVLYVGGEGGVFRSNDGGRTWFVFPSRADGAWMDGGFLPNARVTDLDLSLGNINPTTGRPNQSTGPNLLLATTYGRGSFAIRLDPDLAAGPQVASVTPNSPVSPGTTSFVINFTGAVDPTTFTPADFRTFAGPSGAIVVTSITDLITDPRRTDAHTSYLVTFDAQRADGIYEFTIGPNITDFAGNRMDGNANGTNGEDAADRFSGRFVVNSTDNGRFLSGLFNDLLGRSVDTSGFLTLLSPLDQQRFGQLLNLAGLFVTSAENRAQVVRQLYTFPTGGQLSNFRIGNLLPARGTLSQTEVDFWVSFLANGGTMEQIIQALAASDEYFRDRGGNNNANWLNAFYGDVLGRTTAQDDTATALVAQLEAGTTTRSDVAALILSGDEYRRRLINLGYNNFLGRDASPGELNIWLPILAQPSAGPGQPTRTEQLLTSILGSGEYFFRQADAAGLHTNATWLTSLYTRLLLRQPDVAGFNFLLSGIIGVSQTTRLNDAQMVLGSLEYRATTVRNLYQTYLGRPASDQEALYWASVIAAGQTDEFVGAFITSTDEYFNRTPTILNLGGTAQPSNGTFVNAAYTQVLGRAASPAELAFWVDALAAQVPRFVLTNALFTSEEYQTRQVFRYYSLLNMTSPPADDVAFWVTAIRNGLRDEDVLAIFLSTQTYFTSPHPFP